MGQVQSTARPFRWTDDGNERVGRDLEQGESKTQYEERDQMGGIAVKKAGRGEECAAQCGETKPEDHAAPVSDTFNGITGGHGHEIVDQRSDEVRTKETELHQQALGIGKCEEFLPMRYQYIVQYGNESPKEEERGEYR